MLSLLSFDDDSLPTTRRAVMTTASMLVLTSYLGLKLDFSALGFVTTSTDSISAACILLPLMAYLIWRLCKVSSWYLPITHSEMIRSDPKIVNLIDTLHVFSTTAHDSKELGLALGKLQTADYTKHVELSRQIGSRLDELNRQTNQWMSIFRHVPDRATNSPEQQAEYKDIYSVMAKLNQEIAELQSHILALRSEVLSLKASKLAADVGQYADQIQAVSGDLAGLMHSLDKNAIGSKFQEVLAAIDEIDVDFGSAVQRKKRDILLSGKWLPLSWSFFAIIYSIYNLVCPFAIQA